MKTWSLFYFVFLGLFILVNPLFAQESDSVEIQVHFLYGSVPADSFVDSEPEWFGGKLGGHVGVEIDSGEVLHFLPKGGLHIFARHKKRFHSHFVLSKPDNFWGIFGTPSDSVKKLTVVMRVSKEQKLLLDSAMKSYLLKSPYDYAFFGMRCASATYDVLSQAGIFMKYHAKVDYATNFYPAVFRAKVIAKAERNGWIVQRSEGTNRREWEED